MLWQSMPVARVKNADKIPRGSDKLPRDKNNAVDGVPSTALFIYDLGVFVGLGSFVGLGVG